MPLKTKTIISIVTFIGLSYLIFLLPKLLQAKSEAKESPNWKKVAYELANELDWHKQKIKIFEQQWKDCLVEFEKEILRCPKI